jgi:hypothetical protein
MGEVLAIRDLPQAVESRSFEAKGPGWEAEYFPRDRLGAFRMPAFKLPRGRCYDMDKVVKFFEDLGLEEDLLTIEFWNGDKRIAVRRRDRLSDEWLPF